MSAVLFRGAVVWPNGLLEDGAVLCTGGRIAAVGAGAEVETPPGALEIDGAFVAPGFVDIHVHGGAGADFMDGTLDAVLTATLAHARHGTTTIFPTTTTGSPEQLEAMLAACASVPAGSGARIAGVHLYGPFSRRRSSVATAPRVAATRTPVSTSGTSNPASFESRPVRPSYPVRRRTTAPQLHAAAS